MDEAIINKLRDFGLNSYESRLWVALLSRGVSTAGELSDIANVPRSRSYDVLESLEKKGFIKIEKTKPLRYIAISPRQVIKGLINQLKDKAEQKLKLIDSLRCQELIKGLDQLYTQSFKSIQDNLKTIIKGRTNLYSYLESMIKKAKKSIIIVTTKEGIKRKLKFLKETLTKAEKRGVKISFIIDHKNISGRFCIIDENEILFMLFDDKEVHANYDVGVYFNAPSFVSSFKKIIEFCC